MNWTHAIKKADLLKTEKIKMKKQVLILALLLFNLQAFGQVKMKSERDKEGNVLIKAENNTPIPYTVTINYKSLQNLVPNGGMTSIKVASPGISQVARLKKENPSASATDFNYSYTFRAGDIKAKTKEDFVYLPPVASGQRITIIPMTHIENTLRNEEVNDNYVGLAFRFKEPTTICTPRKGIISEVKIDEKIEGTNVFYNASDNFIEIYHEDGVFTRIMVLKPGSAKVKVGDVVFPGDPLAESGGENYSSGPHVRMVQRKLVQTDNVVRQENIEVLIRGNEGKPIQIQELTEIMVDHPEDFITLEMTKREKKKYLAK